MKKLKILPLLCMMCALAACDSSLNTADLGYPAMKSKAFAVYSKHCRECHAPPLPTAHVAAEWPNVIERMQQHRTERSMGRIPDDQVMILQAYLMQYAQADK